MIVDEFVEGHREETRRFLSMFAGKKRRSKTAAVVAVLAAMTIAGGLAMAEQVQIEVPVGPPEGVRVLTKQNSPGVIGLPLPAGPEAFRVLGTTAWLSDSHGRGVVNVAVQDERLVVRHHRDVPIEWPGELALDVSPAGKINSVWVVDRNNQNIVRLSPAGREIGRVLESACSRGFINITRLEVAPSGMLYAGDIAHNLIVVIDKHGNRVREIEWNGNGFCFDHLGNLVQIVRTSKDSPDWSLIVTDPLDTTVVKAAHRLGMSEEGLYDVWGIRDGSALFTSRGLERTHVDLHSISITTGKTVTLGSLGAQPMIPRFLSLARDGTLWRAVEEYCGEKPVLRLLPLATKGGTSEG